MEELKDQNRKWQWELSDDDDEDFVDIDITKIRNKTENPEAEQEDIPPIAITHVPSEETADLPEPADTPDKMPERETVPDAGQALDAFVDMAADRTREGRPVRRVEMVRYRPFADDEEEDAHDRRRRVNERRRTESNEPARRVRPAYRDEERDFEPKKSSRGTGKAVAIFVAIAVLVLACFLGWKLFNGIFAKTWREAKTDSAVHVLAQKYLNALQSGDASAMRGILDATATIDEAQLEREAAVYESFSDLKCYTTKGLEKNEYGVLMSYSYKIYGIDTPVPAGSWCYMRPDSSGELRLMRQTELLQDEEIHKLVLEASADEDFGEEVVTPLNKAYESAVAADANLKAFFEGNYTLPGATDPQTTEPDTPPATEPPATEPTVTEPPATEPPATQAPTTQPPATQAPENPGTMKDVDIMMYVKNDNVNCRKEPNTSSEVLSVVEKNKYLHVTGDNGTWYRVIVDGKTGYIRKDMMSAYPAE